MNPGEIFPWENLFPASKDESSDLRLRFRLVRKRGHPLLLVPARRSAIGEALGLYPAQTRKAKLARLFLGACLRAGLPFGTEAVTLRVDPRTPFWQFLFPATSASTEACLALLCGNPKVPGGRVMVLVFDGSGRPQKLVKAGAGEDAAARTQAEAAFLKSIRAESVSAPAVLGEFREGGLEALALEYVPGSNPDPQDVAPLAALLESWLRTGQVVRLAELPAWQRLAAVAHRHPRFGVLASALASVRCHPAICHGDFAPWNVRVDPATRRWTVLDWERGEPLGPPGWDWFHYVVQTELLVRRARPGAIVTRTGKLLASDEFRRYAGRAGIEACARPLAVAYLLYYAAVTPPAEGVNDVNELLNTFAHQWLPG